MKKVTIVLPQLWIGGIQELNVQLAAHIHDPRVDVSILSLYPPSGSDIEKRAEMLGVKVRYLNKRSGMDLRIIPQIYRELKAHRPDVLHINQRMTSYCLLPMQLLRIKRKIYVVHNLADKDAHGIARAINRFAFHHLGVTPISISPTCRKSLSQVYRIPEERIPCIVNAVDLKRFSRNTSYTALPQDTCVFMTTCAFRESKNLPMMVRAFAKVHRKHPNTRLILLGDGETKPEVLQSIAENHVEDAVEMPGIVGNVPAWLERAHVYLLSSKFEGPPLSVLEAMSMELPVVATRAGGVVDIVEDGGNGILVDLDDEDAFAQGMNELAENPHKCAEFSRRSKELSALYSIEHCAEEYVNLYVREE